MEYRMLRPEETDRWREFDQYCFQVPNAEMDAFMQHKFSPEPIRCLYESDGTMVATLTNYPFRIYMDGAEIPMAGIAGVASLPENRRGGYVARLLSECIRETREQGMPLSALYPFKQAFYRRYGWEVASAWLVHTIPLRLLEPYRKAGGHVRRYLPAQEDWRELSALYQHFAAPRRGYMVRADEGHWRTWVNAGWRSDRAKFHAALWSPEAGTPAEGYLLYRFDKENDQQVMIARELVTLTRRAELGLWGFIAQHDSQIEAVKYRTPRDFPIWNLVDRAYPAKSEFYTGWMLRIIDLVGAIEQRPWPQGVEGRMLIGFTDEQAPWNQGTWSTTIADGRAAVRPAPAETATLVGPVQTWSQLYSGLVTPAQAIAAGHLAASDDRAVRLLSDLVAGPPLFFYEYF